MTKSYIKIIRKVICALVAFAFLFNVVLQDAWAVMRAPEATIGGPLPGFDIEQIEIPNDLATVVDSWQSVDRHTTYDIRHTIIHIQDAHCNYAAQHRIAEIIKYLNEKYGIDTVNLEGGKGNYDLSVFTDIKEKDVREKVADHFMGEGFVNGAEFFAVNDPGKVKLWGIEDEELYRENLNIYRDTLRDKKEIDLFIASLADILNVLKQKMFSEKLLELDSRDSGFKAGILELKEYLVYLIKGMGETGIDIKSFANISILSDVIKNEDVIDFKKAERERDELIDRLQRILSQKEIEELVVKVVRFKQEKLSQKDFYSYLAGKARALNMDLRAFPELVKYTGYVSTYEGLDKDVLMEEVEELVGALKEKLFRNGSERELDKLSRGLLLVKNLFDVRLTSREYAYFRKNEASFDTANYLAFFEKNAGISGVLRVPADLEKLDQYRGEMARFYECSLKRDEAFLRNTQYPIRNTQYEPRVTVLITGGFHTENLTKLFREKGISYVSLMPKFKEPDGYKCPYFQVLSGEKTPGVNDAPGVSELAVPDALSELEVPGLGKEKFIEAVNVRELAEKGENMPVGDEEIRSVREEVSHAPVKKSYGGVMGFLKRLLGMGFSREQKEIIEDETVKVVDRLLSDRPDEEKRKISEEIAGRISPFSVFSKMFITFAGALRLFLLHLVFGSIGAVTAYVMGENIYGLGLCFAMGFMFSQAIVNFLIFYHSNGLFPQDEYLNRTAGLVSGNMYLTAFVAVSFFRTMVAHESVHFLQEYGFIKEDVDPPVATAAGILRTVEEEGKDGLRRFDRENFEYGYNLARSGISTEHLFSKSFSWSVLHDLGSLRSLMGSREEPSVSYVEGGTLAGIAWSLKDKTRGAEPVWEFMRLMAGGMKQEEAWALVGIEGFLEKDLVDYIRITKIENNESKILDRRVRLLEKAGSLDDELRDHLDEAMPKRMIFSKEEVPEFFSAVRQMNDGFFLKKGLNFYLSPGFLIKKGEATGKADLRPYRVVGSKSVNVGGEKTNIYYLRSLAPTLRPDLAGLYNVENNSIFVMRHVLEERSVWIKRVLDGFETYDDPVFKESGMEKAAELITALIRKGKGAFAGKTEKEIMEILESLVVGHELIHRENDVHGVAQEMIKVLGKEAGDIREEISTYLSELASLPATYYQLTVLLYLSAIPFDRKDSQVAAGILNLFSEYFHFNIRCPDRIDGPVSESDINRNREAIVRATEMIVEKLMERSENEIRRAASWGVYRSRTELFRGSEEERATTELFASLVSHYRIGVDTKEAERIAAEIIGCLIANDIEPRLWELLKDPLILSRYMEFSDFCKRMSNERVMKDISLEELRNFFIGQSENISKEAQKLRITRRNFLISLIVLFLTGSWKKAFAGSPTESEAEWMKKYSDPKIKAIKSYDGKVSYYADSLAGNITSNGEYYDPGKFTAAHRTLPFDSIVRVTNLSNGKQVVVRINDRGPFETDGYGNYTRELDLSRVAAEKIGMIDAGVVGCKIELMRKGPEKSKTTGGSYNGGKDSGKVDSYRNSESGSIAVENKPIPKSIGEAGKDLSVVPDSGSIGVAGISVLLGRSDEGRGLPEKAAAMYVAAKGVVPAILEISRKAPTYVIEPVASYEKVSPVMDVLKDIERKAGKHGHCIRARGYQAEGDWLTSLEGEIDKLLPLFLEDVSKENKTRMIIRMMSRNGESVSEEKKWVKEYIVVKLASFMGRGGGIFSLDKARELVESKIKFVIADIGSTENLNTTIDLFADITMAECDRYGKDKNGRYKADGYQEDLPEELAKRFFELLSLSITNFKELEDKAKKQAKGGSDVPVMILSLIFSGFALKIRPINWESVREWKLGQDRVLQSL